MKIRASILLTSAIAVFLLSSCQRGTFNPAEADSYFPLRSGASWTYRFIDRPHDTSQILTDRVVGIGRLDGPATAIGKVVSEVSRPDGTHQSAMLYVVEGGYITRVSTLGEPRWNVFEERRFLPQLLRPGLRWSNSLHPFGQVQTTMSVEQTHRTFLERRDVVVPGGRFSGCIRIETEAVYKFTGGQPGDEEHLKYIDWYAPNIGLVKTRVVKKQGLFGFRSEVASVELLSFAKSNERAAVHVSVRTPGETHPNS